MANRITRYSLEFLYYTRKENGKVESKPKTVFKVVWTKGEDSVMDIIKAIPCELLLAAFLDDKEYFKLVEECKENSNVVMDCSAYLSVSVRRWSYHRK